MVGAQILAGRGINIFYRSSNTFCGGKNGQPAGAGERKWGVEMSAAAAAFDTWGFQMIHNRKSETVKALEIQYMREVHAASDIWALVRW